MKTQVIINPVAEIENIVNYIKNYFVENGNLNTKAVIGISGGKDSTIAAALLCRALGPNRVIGVMMPEHTQTDIDDSRRVCEHLGIQGIEVDIGPACNALYRAINEERDDAFSPIELNPIVFSNTPARIRMTTLYAIAADIGGRVVNTCNWSEEYVGYSTKYGDAAGDFTVLGYYTVTEVLQIGDALGLPEDLVHKTPSDGMCGKTDEDNLGFTYEVLDDYIRNHIIPDCATLDAIVKKNKYSAHKRKAIQLPGPRPELLTIDERGNILNEGDYWF
jgi:NAD+ synthase